MAKTSSNDQDAVFEAMAAAIAPRPLDPARRERMRARLQARIRETGPEGTRTLRASDSGWQVFLPLIDVKILHRDEQRGRQTALYRVQAGGEFPAHPHHEHEECLVLEGEVNIGALCLRSGDYHFAGAGSLHSTVRSRPGALLLITQALHA